jgi:glutamine synthetase
VFGDPNGQDKLSDTGRSFIAGVIEHARALLALAAPTTNSYKRLRLGDLVPQAADWGLDDRTRFVRVPAERGPGARAEIRVGDASANLYLATAAALHAGMDGVERALPLTKGPSPAKRLPQTLGESLAALTDDQVLVEALGADAVAQFIEVKEAELLRESRHITDWELNEYRNAL